MDDGREIRLRLELFASRYMADDSNMGFRDEFRAEVRSLFDSVSAMNIVFSDLQSDSHILTILFNMFEVITKFHKIDLLEPVNNSDYILYMKFCQLFIRYKTLFISEHVIGDIRLRPDVQFLFIRDTEQYLCDTYKLKLKKFKANNDKRTVQEIEEEFTRFLLEFIKMLSRLKIKRLLKKHIELLLEVASLNVLVENIHLISSVIYAYKKLFIWESVTKFIIDEGYILEDSKLLNSIDINFKLEACIMTYYTLRHICEYLEFQNLSHASKMLSMFKIEEIILCTELVGEGSNKEFDRKHVQLIKYINFKTYKTIETVSSPKILKCVKVLQLLLNSFNGSELHNCPFAIVIFSLLYDLVMATDVDKKTIVSLINLAIDYLEICKLPSKFKAVSYAFKIYQKFKSDNDLKMKSIHLCKSIAINFKTHEINKDLIGDLESVINNEENWVDKSVVTSYFLSGIKETSNIEGTALNNIFCTLNEQIILLSHEQDKSLSSILVFPYSVVLKFSMLNENKDYLFNNLAVLNDYVTFLFDKNKDIPLDDKTYFMLAVLQNYGDVGECLPNGFLHKCFKYVLNPFTMNFDVVKILWKVIPPNNFEEFIEILKIETLTVIKESKKSTDEKYNSYLYQIWSDLLNMELKNSKKLIRKTMVHHFCFIMDKTFLFRPKIVQTEQGLKLLLKLMCLLLKLPWVNTTLLIKCSLRILTFVEKSSVLSDIHVFTEAAELLIVLYKCPNNAIKPFLGLFVASFSQLFGKCWSFMLNIIDSGQKYNEEQSIPFHKFEKCSSLFRQNKSDFYVICRYFLKNMVELFAYNVHLTRTLMRQCDSIVFNIMDVCCTEELEQLTINISGPALLTLNGLCTQYRTLGRYTGRV